MNGLIHSSLFAPSNILYVASLASVLTLLVGLLLTFQSASLRPVRPQGLRSGFTRRVLAMELVQSVDDVDDILGKNRKNCHIMIWQQRIDFVFIVLYVAAFVFLAIPAGRLNLSWGIAITVLAAIAGCTDVIEDLGIIAIARAETVTVQQIKRVRGSALTKWCAIFLLLTVLAPLYWTFCPPIAKVASVLLLTAGVFGVAVIFSGNARLIERATGLMSIAMLLATIAVVWTAFWGKCPA